MMNPWLELWAGAVAVNKVYGKVKRVYRMVMIVRLLIVPSVDDVQLMAEELQMPMGT